MYFGTEITYNVLNPLPRQSPAPAAASSGWRPPIQGMVKVNVDASFTISDDSASWGAIIRDHHGVVIAWAWNSLMNCPNAESAEATACLEGAKLLRMFSNLPATIENDNVSVINAINSTQKCHSHLCGIIEDIKQIMSFDPGITYHKINRSDNEMEHGLANWSRSVLCSGVLCDSVSSCVLSQVIKLLIPINTRPTFFKKKFQPDEN